MSMDETASTFTPSNHTILIIDDEPDICELLQFKLKNEGYKIFQLPTHWKLLARQGMFHRI